jgi:archaellum component FlaG (FlaF/FlaG flagellin family)
MPPTAPTTTTPAPPSTCWPTADLALTKIKRAKTATTGGNDTVVVAGNTSASDMRSTLTLKNNGPSRITGQAQIVDVLADGEEYIGVERAVHLHGIAGGLHARQSADGDLQLQRHVPDRGECQLHAADDHPRACSRSGQLSNSACTGGSGGSSEPLTEGGVNMDKITANDCTGPVGIRSTSAGSNLSISKVTSTPTGGDKVVSISENAVTYTLTVTNTGTATPGRRGQRPAARLGERHDGSQFRRHHVSGRLELHGQRRGFADLQVRHHAAAPGASATITITLHNSGNTPGFLMDSVGNAADAACPSAPANTFCNHAGVGVDGNEPVPSASRTGATTMPPTGCAWSGSPTCRPREADHQQPHRPGRRGFGLSHHLQECRPVHGAERVVFNDVFTLPAGDAGFVLIKAGLAPSTPTAR